MQDPYARTKESYENEISHLRTDLRDAVELMSQSFEAKTTFYDFLNRPSIKAVMGEKGMKCKDYRDYEKTGSCSHRKYTGPLNGFICSRGYKLCSSCTERKDKP